ncbi:hypothetical protein [Yersinia intermedia]
MPFVLEVAALLAAFSPQSLALVNAWGFVQLPSSCNTNDVGHDCTQGSTDEDLSSAME